MRSDLSAFLLIACLCSAQPASAQFGPPNPIAPGSDVGVRFDVPQVAEATIAQPAHSTAHHNGDLLVDVELTLSVIVDSLTAPKIDQLLVEITPRSGWAIVTDYAPRTELASNYSGGIEVQRTDESTRTVAMAIDGRYPPIAGGSLTATQGDRNTAMMKYNRVAPMHLIAASGTTRRGRGVYFKFRSTDQQIIEGDRVVRMTLQVPPSWRGELIEVMITGDSHRSGFPAGVATLTGLQSKPQRVGTGRFLVAAYRSDCPEARQAARQLADAEAAMRRHVHTIQAGDNDLASGLLTNPASLLRHVSRRIDWSETSNRDLPVKSAVALHKALDGSLDPHADRDFRDLPVDTRAAFLNYIAARKTFGALCRTTRQPSSENVAQAPANVANASKNALTP
jgi:hypothetical protein